MSLQFEKWHGIGNDFVLIDGLPDGIAEGDLPELARAVCQRTFGIGADGLLVALPPVDADARMAMYNPDGSEAEMCGNGLRCFAMWHHQGRESAGDYRVETRAGSLRSQVRGDQVAVEMGVVQILPGPVEIELDGHRFDSCGVDVGNPHLVVFCPSHQDVKLAEWGRRLENHSAFPNRTNVHFVSLEPDGTLRQSTWERGAGITLACGTGACASAAAARGHGWCGDSVLIHLPGGDLQIDFEGNLATMTGPAVRSFTGTWIGRRGAWPDGP
ncbi:MAG: diaminopimelate epimerase [Armatimonadetes bacterium]|nr:diaminopimelate epimerase [Armatimonadota bacterium]MBX3109313.1 diaminopimelate epimerase [Fimbriimonadaceae bacterium]